MKEICHLTGLPGITERDVKLDKIEIREAIKVSHLQFLKEEMRGVKLEKMRNTDRRTRRLYTKWPVEMCRMAFRLESFQFECRSNMPNRYGRDLICRACRPQRELSNEQKEQKEQGEQKEQEKQKEQEEYVEDQKHLEVCKGYSELWDGLGPATEESRVIYFMRVQNKRLKQQQVNKQQQINEQKQNKN